MTTQLRERTLALLLLLAGALPSQSLADSPAWADEHLLLVWPEALGSTVSSDEGSLVVGTSGHVTISDDEILAVSTSGLELIEPGVMDAAAELQTASAVHPSAWRRLSYLHAPSQSDPNCYNWYILPAGVLYKSYIAGEKEPRMAAAYLSEKDRGSVFDATIGGRLGFVRYGTPGPINPQGFEWDLEAAAMLRQDIEQELDVEAVDFRIGTVLTWRRGPTAVKAGYYHLSSHLGDEFLLRNPGYPRLNYVRDSLLVGVRQNLRPDFTLYGEVAYAFNVDGGAEPLELQFGAEYTPIDNSPNRTNAPVFAINGHTREEFDFGGSVNIIAGWEWRGRHSNRRLRIGGQYYNGKELQWSFYNESVSLTGLGIWYDF